MSQIHQFRHNTLNSQKPIQAPKMLLRAEVILCN
jgi:hypothetical protein